MGDFGLCRYLNEESIAESFAGSLRYCAPEMIIAHSYTNKADIWTLGVVLFEIVTQEKFVLTDYVSIINWKGFEKIY